MTREDAAKVLNALWKYKDCGFSEKEIREALDLAIKGLETVEDGKRKAQEQKSYNDFKIMSKLQETNDLEKSFEQCKCMLLTNERIIFDMAKSLAIIADELSEAEKAENIFDVYKNEKNTERKEVIEMLTIIKKQAHYKDSNTLIENVRLSSFKYVIDSAIKLLEAESDEKNETTK